MSLLKSGYENDLNLEYNSPIKLEFCISCNISQTIHATDAKSTNWFCLLTKGIISRVTVSRSLDNWLSNIYTINRSWNDQVRLKIDGYF